MLVKNLGLFIALRDGGDFTGRYRLKRMAFRMVILIEGPKAPTGFQVNHLKRPLSMLVHQGQHQVGTSVEIHVHLVHGSTVSLRISTHATITRIARCQHLSVVERQFGSNGFYLPAVQGFTLDPSSEQTLVDERTQQQQPVSPRGLSSAAFLFKAVAKLVHHPSDGLLGGKVGITLVSPRGIKSRCFLTELAWVSEPDLKDTMHHQTEGCRFRPCTRRGRF